MTRYKADGSSRIRREKEYDSMENLTKYISYDDDGSIINWEEYEYITITPQ